METEKFFARLAATAACCLLFSGFATAADNPPASATGKSAPKSAAAQRPPVTAGGIRLSTERDEEMRVAEREEQRAVRSRELTALAQQDLDAKRYKEALEKVKLALEINPKNAEAKRIKKKAQPLAK